MEVAVIQLLAFLAVFFLVVGIRTAFKKREEEAHSEKPKIYQFFSHETAVLGALIGPWMERAFPAETARMRNDLIAAALPLAVFEVRGMQLFACLSLSLGVGAVIVILSLNVAYALLGSMLFGFLGWVYPGVWVAKQAEGRKDRMSRGLPYAIDLITVSMEAGQDFGASVRNLVSDGPRGPLRDEFGITLRQIELGKSRIDGLKAMAERIQLDEFRSLVTAVVQSSEMGASIAMALKLQAEEVRRRRFQRAERKAARAPSLIVIPTALFILPAVFIVIFVPVIMRAVAAGVGR